MPWWPSARSSALISQERIEIERQHDLAAALRAILISQERIEMRLRLFFPSMKDLTADLARENWNLVVIFGLICFHRSTDLARENWKVVITADRAQEMMFNWSRKIELKDEKCCHNCGCILALISQERIERFVFCRMCLSSISFWSRKRELKVPPSYSYSYQIRFSWSRKRELKGPC